MGSWIENAGRVFRRISRGGFLFTFASVLVGAAAIVSGNNLLFLVLSTMLSVLLVSGLVSKLGLAGLELDFALPEHVSVGRTVAATLAVRNTKRWMPSFSVRVGGVASEFGGPSSSILNSSVYFPIIPGGATLAEHVDVFFPRRGAYTQNTFAFSTRFPFGFREKTASVSLLREIVVYPSIDPHPGFEQLLAEIHGELETHYRGRGSDFYRIRPYQAFESARHVDWKATAHTGALQVREFSRDQERPVEIYLDRHVPAGEEEWFERAIDCCAFLAWRMAQHNIRFRFRAHGFQTRVPEDGDVYTILRYLALVYATADDRGEPPFDETDFQIVFSARLRHLESLGWRPAHCLGPGSFPSDPAGARP